MSYNQYGSNGSSDSYYNPNQAHGNTGGYNQGYNQQNTYESQGGYNQGHNEQNNHANQGYGTHENSHGNNQNPYGYQHHPSGNQEYAGGSHENEHGSRPYGDLNSAADHAEEHHPAEDKSLFSSALKFAKERMNKEDDPKVPNEEDAKKAHHDLYGSGDPGKTHDSESIGAGAAMDILKKFTEGGSENDSDKGSKGSSNGGGMDLNKILGLAMAQAGKLFDEKNSSGKASGDKQSAVNAAAAMAMKLYMKKQMKQGGAAGLVQNFMGGSHNSGSGSSGGGAASIVQGLMGGGNHNSGDNSHNSGNSSGAAGIMKLAGKFL